MGNLLDYPLLVFVLSFVVLSLSAAIGALFSRGRDLDRMREH